MIIGLTGQSGAGKTTLSALFEKSGFFVINADKVARTVTGTKEASDALMSAFGKDIFTEEGVDRKKLASVVFSDKAELYKLNTVLLPIICEEIKRIISENSGRDILLDAPTLFESGLDSVCDKTVAVICDRETLLKRIIARDFLTKDEAQKRLSSQKNDTFFRESCDIIINNSGTEEEFLHKSLKLISLLKGE